MKKRKHPRWRRANMEFKKRVKDTWRRPRGQDSKQRKKLKGYGKMPTVGYRQDKRIRGLHPSGYEEVLIRCVDDVHNVDPETQAIRIASTIGKRKRLEIMKIAEEKGIKVLNPVRINGTQSS